MKKLKSHFFCYLVFLNMGLISCSKSPTTEIITVKSCSMGDYFWITGVTQRVAASVEKNYLMQASIKEDSNICPDDQNKKAASQKIKVTTVPVEICQHMPPCEKDEPLTKVTAIIKYEILK